MDKNLFRQAGILMGLGTQFAITILIGFFLGDWLDKELDSSPVLMLLLTFTFAALGMYNFVKQANRTVNDRNN